MQVFPELWFQAFKISPKSIFVKFDKFVSRKNRFSDQQVQEAFIFIFRLNVKSPPNFLILEILVNLLRMISRLHACGRGTFNVS